MNKFAKKINANLKQLKIEPDTAWLAQSRLELTSHINSVKVKPKRQLKFNKYSEVFKLLIQPMPVAMASFGLTLLIGSAAISYSQATLPGDTLYPLKRASEQIVLSLANNPQLQSQLQITYENRRLNELALLNKYPPAIINDYKTNSLLIISHLDQETLQEKLSAHTPEQPISPKLAMVANKDSISTKQFINKNPDTSLSNPPKLAIAPIIEKPNMAPELKLNDTIKYESQKILEPAISALNKSQMTAHGAPSEKPVEELNDTQSSITKEQPSYANLGGGGSVSVNKPATPPVDPEPSATQPLAVAEEHEIITVQVPPNTVIEETETPAIESNIEANRVFAAPAKETPLMAEDDTDQTQDIETATSTPSEILEGVNEEEITEEEPVDEVNDGKEPTVQDQPAQDLPPDESSSDENNTTEQDIPDSSNKTIESDTAAASQEPSN